MRVGDTRRGRSPTALAGSGVTAVWLAALFLGQEWWLAALLVGYLAVVPAVSSLVDASDARDSSSPSSDRVAGAADVEALKARYVRGELTDEEFERELEGALDAEAESPSPDRARRARER